MLLDLHISRQHSTEYAAKCDICDIENIEFISDFWKDDKQKSSPKNTFWRL